MTHENRENETIQRFMDGDWTVARLREAAELHRRITDDAELARVVGELDALRRTLSPSEYGAGDAPEPVGGQDAFADRLQRVVEKSGRGPGQSHWLLRAMPGAFGGALAAVVVWVLISLVPHQTAPQPQVMPQPVVAGPDLRLMPDSPQQQRQMLDELAAFYEGKAGWVATTATNMRMGLGDTPVAWREPVVMRLTLSGPDGQTVQTDLAALPGQVIDLDAATPDGQAVRYQIRVSTDGPSNGYVEDSIALTAVVDGTDSVTTHLPLAGPSVRPVGRLLTRTGTYEVHLGVAEH